MSGTKQVVRPQCAHKPTRCVHYVGFRDDRYLSALRVFGGPVFIHRVWDKRANRDIGEDDLVVFAYGPHDQIPRDRSGNDLDEPDDPARRN